VAAAEPGTVYIETDIGGGTGVVFHSDGYIVTNEHVVSETTRITITTASGSTFRATVMSRDATLDLAIVRIEGSDLPVIPFSDVGGLHVGDDVIALGYPLGADLGDSVSVTRGIVSAFRSDEGGRRQLVQTDAALNPGNSGGPLVNDCGQLVGINTLRIEGIPDSAIQNIGFAIRVDTVLTHLRTKLESRRVPSIATSCVPPPPTALRPSPTPTIRSSPTPSPTPLPTATPSTLSLIAFYSERDGNAEIYVMNADGSWPAKPYQ
jgi:S1-C subfamily serine protease